MSESPEIPVTRRRRRVETDLDGGEWNARALIRMLNPGEPLMGVEPGKWEPDEYGLPPHCPVRPLGFKGDTFFLLNARGGVSTLPDGSSAGKDRWDRIFAGYIRYLWWAFPAYVQVTKEIEATDDEGNTVITKKKIWVPDRNYKAEVLRQVMFDAIEKAGPWDMVERVRGRGAWKDDMGRLVLHLGDRVYIDGKLHEPGPGAIDGYVYPKLPPITAPVDEVEPGGTDSSAHELLGFIQTWEWARPDVDPHLLLGWLCQAMIGGALDVRPPVFLTGDRAVGKSTAQKLAKYILGDNVIQTKETTPAGLYQRVGHDSRACAVDELEAGADNRRVMDIIKLARLAYDGGLMLRGGANHEGVEFQARSPFFFSSINPPPLNYQDRSRMAILALRPLKKTIAGPRWTESDLRDIGRVLMRRMMWWWKDGRLHDLIQSFRGRMIERGGHDSRGADTFGTLVACAHAALSDDPPDSGLLDEWAKRLSVKSLNEFDIMEANWRACFNLLLQKAPEPLRTASAAKTVGGVLGRLRAGMAASHPTGINAAEANASLQNVGLQVGWKRGDVRDFGNIRLFVPANHPALGAIFDGTPWNSQPGAPGVWNDALRQAPNDYFESGVGRVGDLTSWGTHLYIGRIFAADDARAAAAEV